MWDPDDEDENDTEENFEFEVALNRFSIALEAMNESLDRMLELQQDITDILSDFFVDDEEEEEEEDNEPESEHTN